MRCRYLDVKVEEWNINEIGGSWLLKGYELKRKCSSDVARVVKVRYVSKTTNIVTTTTNPIIYQCEKGADVDNSNR